MLLPIIALVPCVSYLPRTHPLKKGCRKDLSTKNEKLAISCNLFHTWNVFTHPTDNIWFDDGVDYYSQLALQYKNVFSALVSFIGCDMEQNSVVRLITERWVVHFGSFLPSMKWQAAGTGRIHHGLYYG